MIYKIIVLVFLLSCSSFTVNSQCIPDVSNINLEGTTLTWPASSSCNGTTYLVSIYAFDTGVVEFVGEVSGGSLDVSFLPYCRSLVFTISAVAEKYVGPYSQIAGFLPFPEDSNITIASFTGSKVDRNVVLEWHVSSQYRFCLDTFKLLLWDEESVEPEQISTIANKFSINEATPCMSYQVDISVVYSSIEYPASRFNYFVPAAVNTPSLQALEQYATSIKFTWALESYAVNRCEVFALHITGTATNTTIAFQDSPERQPIEITIPGLRANTMYYFNVTTRNEGGVSNPYQLAVQTLPVESQL